MAKIAVVGDIHINLKHNAAFEEDRVMKLAKILSLGMYREVIINGDLLDSAKPTIKEIQLAQLFIDTLAVHSDVVLLDGNHEGVDVAKKLSTYDFVRMHNCVHTKDCVVIREGVNIRLTSWSHLKALTKQSIADVLITHVRCDLPPHITAERDMKFLDNYKLCILSDIHSKHSPNSNSHYTNSPYAVNFNSANPNGSYIELNVNNGKFSWKYIDLQLPQKVKLVGNVKDFKEFLPKEENMYKVVVTGTIEELRTLRAYRNVKYFKVIKQITSSVEEIPETVDLLELLVNNVAKTNNYVTKQKLRAQKLIGDLLNGISS